MDEGLPIAYEVLDPGVTVYATDGQPVGMPPGLLWVSLAE